MNSSYEYDYEQEIFELYVEFWNTVKELEELGIMYEGYYQDADNKILRNEYLELRNMFMEIIASGIFSKERFGNLYSRLRSLQNYI